MVSNSVLLLVLILSNLFAAIKGQYASDYPSPIPVVIKSPYFNFWLASDANITTPGGRWPVFYSGVNVTWSGFIRVDGTGYNFQGVNLNYTTAKTIGAYITPTRTVFTINAGPVGLNLTYLSPIELTDWTLHSFPFAYVAINVWSTDSQLHHVQIYSDVSGDFVSSNTSNEIIWNTTQTQSGNSIYHRVKRIKMESLTENKGMAEDGTLYFATVTATNLTWQTGAARDIQSEFFANGSLNNTKDSSYRSISSNTPVMAFAFDLGNVTSSDPIVFTVGLVRDPVLTYMRGQSVENRTSLWMSQWSTIDTGIDTFLSNYASAVNRAITLDTKIMSDAANVTSSSNATSLYQNLVALNLRQTIGALEFTTSTLADGFLAGTSDLRVFMKDVGNSLRVNPVEAIYAAFPAYLYLNASLAESILQPLLEFQSTPSLYSQRYAAPDLGSSWPQVKGNNTDQSVYAVENCGSMLVMALAHARKSGDGSLIHSYYSTLKTWADYLVKNGLQPNGSLSSDNIAETSNLALKAIMGIFAMGQINMILEASGANSADTKNYLDTATSYANQWESLAFSYDHITSTYGNQGSWGLIYNLYLPTLLGAGLISQNIYDAQAAWYIARLESTDSFGSGYDSNDPNTAKGHWDLLTAGSVYNTSVTAARDGLLTKAETRPYFKNIENKPNPSTYAADQGTTISGISSPALGASFVLLAFTVPDQSSITLPSGSINMGSNSNSNRRNEILGGTLGGIAGLLLLALILFFFCRCRSPHRIEEEEFEKPVIQSPSLVEGYPLPATTTAPHSSGSSKAQLMMKYEEIGPSTSDLGSRGGDAASESSQQQQQQRLVPRRPAILQVANLAPGEDNPVPSPIEPKLQPVRRPTEDDQLRRQVEQLRMEMDAMRQMQRQSRIIEEPPPGYAES